MNNENKNLSDLYGVEIDTKEENRSEPVQPQPQVQSTPAVEPQPVQTPQQPVSQPQPVPNNPAPQPVNNSNSSKKAGSPIILLIIIIIICFGLYKVFIDNKNLNDKDKFNIINVNPEDQKKEEMIKIFKSYTNKIKPYVESKKYSCEDSFMKPTSFGIEIDTSSGNSIAQKNAALLMDSNTKSPWDNKDIKGYIYIDQHSSYDIIFYVNLSDNNYGLSRETDVTKITKTDIVTKNPYPVMPSKYKRCILGDEDYFDDEEDW